MLWEKNEGKKLRQHQIDMLQVCREIAASGPGQSIEEIDVFATPGGGKSTIPIIAAAELIGSGYADKICWIVPRVSLQEQAELQFLDRWFRNAFNHVFKIRLSTNDVDPSRGTCGFVTTYQALAADAAGTVRREFDRYRYILVADEIHHVAVDSQWHQALQPLVDRARIFIPMSGSLYRSDGQKIAFLRYREIPGGEQLDMRTSERIRVIQYDRVAALTERAIIPIQVTFQDCIAEWIDRDGASRSVGSFDEVTDDSSDALFTALRTSFAFQMIDKSLQHFKAYKLTHSRNKILFVAPDIRTAKEYLKTIKEIGVKVLLATSEESEEAREAIRRFKLVGVPGAVDGLVTVAMAYEGMDVPPISHLVCLTHIRSAPWIDQMIARATRFDRDGGPWREQVAYLFVPDDPKMIAIIKKLIDQQVDVISGLPEDSKDDTGGGNGGAPAQPIGSVIPIAGSLTDGRMIDFSTQENMPREEYALISKVMDLVGLVSATPMELRRFSEALQAEKDRPQESAPDPEPPVTPDSRREKRMKSDIEQYCRRNDYNHQWNYGETSRQVWAKFGKSRDVMDLTELAAVWAWLQKTYPVREDS
jgi:superfamily II DNA or RNA helicase